MELYQPHQGRKSFLTINNFAASGFHTKQSKAVAIKTSSNSWLFVTCVEVKDHGTTHWNYLKKKMKRDPQLVIAMRDRQELTLFFNILTVTLQYKQMGDCSEIFPELWIRTSVINQEKLWYNRFYMVYKKPKSSDHDFATNINSILCPFYVDLIFHAWFYLKTTSLFVEYIVKYHN